MTNDQDGVFRILKFTRHSTFVIHTERMKAAFIQQPGPPESIQFGDLPKPALAPQQVLVRVGAVAVNPIDTYIRGGLRNFDRDPRIGVHKIRASSA